jgi:hypothetical protein
MSTNRRSRRGIFLFVSVGLLSLFGQPPQGPTGGGTPIIPPDHPELYFSFLTSHRDLGTAIAGLKVSNKAKGDAVEGNRASSLGLSVLELKQLDDLAKPFDQKLKRIEQDIKKELDSADKGKRKADEVLLNRLQAERHLLIIGTMYRVRTSITSGSWLRLQSYINDQHRRGLRVINK